LPVGFSFYRSFAFALPDPFSGRSFDFGINSFSPDPRNSKKEELIIIRDNPFSLPSPDHEKSAKDSSKWAIR
jgi:hypothetical protein